MAIEIRSAGIAGLAQSHARASRRFNPKFLIASVVLLGVLGYLGYNALQTAAITYYYPTEIIQKAATFAPDQQLRMTGKFVPGSDRFAAATDSLAFDVLDPNDNTTVMHVLYTGARPDTFGRPNVSVVATGAYKVINGQPTLVAKDLLTKCPSKYESGTEDGTGR